MCQFLSGIGMKNGDIICHPEITSHEDLINYYDFKETASRNWVRIEYVPEGDYADIANYHLKVDDKEFDWIENIKDKWVRKLNAKLKRMIITDDRAFLGVGCYILGKCIIGKLYYSTIIHAGHAMIEDAGHATVEDAKIG